MIRDEGAGSLSRTGSNSPKSRNISATVGEPSKSAPSTSDATNAAELGATHASASTPESERASKSVNRTPASTDSRSTGVGAETPEHPDDGCAGIAERPCVETPEHRDDGCAEIAERRDDDCVETPEHRDGGCAEITERLDDDCVEIPQCHNENSAEHVGDARASKCTQRSDLSIPLLKRTDFRDGNFGVSAASPPSGQARVTARSNVSYFSIHTPVASPQRGATPVCATSEHESASTETDRSPTYHNLTQSVRMNEEWPRSMCTQPVRSRRSLEQRVYLLEKQLKERTRTAQKYADCAGRLSQENRDIEEKISTKLAAQGEFLQDYGLFLVCAEEFPRASSLTEFKQTVARRVGASWCDRLEVQADHFYRGHALDEYPTYALSKALVNRYCQRVRSLISTVAAIPVRIALLPFKAAMLPFRLATRASKNPTSS